MKKNMKIRIVMIHQVIIIIIMEIKINHLLLQANYIILEIVFMVIIKIIIKIKAKDIHHMALEIVFIQIKIILIQIKNMKILMKLGMGIFMEKIMIIEEKIFMELIIIQINMNLKIMEEK